MPSRAARWISAITLRSWRPASRRPGCQPDGAVVGAAAWVSKVVIAAASVRVVDLEGVELPRRAVAPEGRDVEPGHPRPVEQLAQLLPVVVREVLLHAVGAEAGDGAAHVDVRLVDRVAERLAGVAADDEPPRLRHESAHVADRALDGDVDALHRDAAARRGVAADVEQAAVRRGAGRLARVAVDDD